MKKRNRNTRLTNARQRKLQFRLDVNNRGGKERWNLFRRVFGFTFKLVLIGGISFGAWVGGARAWKKLFWENPDYCLKDVRYTTDGSLSREQALNVAGLKPGHNIFSYNLDKSHDALRKMPQVANVMVKRYLPNRIEVQVTERRPVAWLIRKADDSLAASDSSLLLDASGLVFKPKRVLPEQEVLPVIHGVEVGDLVPGTPVRTAEMLAALELLRSTAENPSLRVISIDLSRGYCLVAADQNRRKITFGLDDIPGQLARFDMVLNECAKMDQQIETINLIPERNIPVSFVTAVEHIEQAPEEIPRAEVVRPPAERAAPAPRHEERPAPAVTPSRNNRRNSPAPETIRKPFRRNA